MPPANAKPVVWHIPVCPFSQRLEILLALKGLQDAVEFRVVDITKPRDPKLLAKSDGTTALPLLENEESLVLKESLVILRYLEQRFPDPPVAKPDPYLHAVENMLVALEGPFVNAGYGYVMNQDPNRREALRAELLAQYALLDAFLRRRALSKTFLFEDFGWAEAVFTPMFMRFWFVEYYEGFELPDTPEYERVRIWREACLAHPAAQQVSREAIIKLNYDYARGCGNGALPPGRQVSSFVFEPDWRARPWPPADKFGHHATDAELGLVKA